MAGQLQDSILTTIKKMLGLDVDYDAFDVDVVTHINTALMTLQQLGVGPEEGMFITGQDETWADFFAPNQMLEAVKTYIYIQVRKIFDPPTNSFVLDSLSKTAEMLEYRLKEQARFFDAEQGKYVRRTPTPIEDEPVDNSSDNSGVVTSLGFIGQAVHIERDGITPLDDIGQNVILKGGNE